MENIGKLHEMLAMPTKKIDDLASLIPIKELLLMESVGE